MKLIRGDNEPAGAPRVLIIDDDRVLLESLPRTLSLHIPHIIVDTADSGAGALTQLAETDYHAAVCDTGIPDMDAFFLLGEIRRHRPHIPVLMLAESEDQTLVMAALRGGACDLIRKPIDHERLVISLDRAIAAGAADREALQHQHTLDVLVRELQRMIDERTRELRDAKESKDRFLAILAHELRNPLAPIHHAAELLKISDDVPPTLRNACDIIGRQVGHIARLLDDLLDISRIEHGKIRLERRPVEIGPIVRHAVETCMPMLDILRHELRVDIPERDLRVDGDPIRLEQIVTNLLNNAAKYTEPGGRIEVAIRHDGRRVTVHVRDTGIGIDTDMITRVFDLFTQAEQALDRSQGGLGVGLTLVRHLVHMHDGEVRASSAGLGLGSEFAVTLPLMSAGDVRPERPSGSARGGKPQHVLVVEDNADSRVMLGELLRLWGHWPNLAADGHAGVEAAQRMLPDIALVDIGLPGIDGYEVARQIRALPGSASTYLVALTGYGQPDDRRRCLEAGFDAHLIKPVKMEELLRVLTADCIAS